MASVTVVVLLATTGLLMGLGAVAWRNRSKQGATAFAVLQVLSAVWTATTALGLSTPPGALRLRLWGTTSGLSLVVIVAWLWFIVSYTGSSEWLGLRRLGVASVPLVLGGVTYAVSPTWGPLVAAHTQDKLAAGTVVAASVGPVGVLLGLYLYLLFAMGIGLVVRTVLEGPRLFVGQALTFVFGSLISIVASMVALAGVTVQGYPLTQVAVGAQSLLLGYAVFGQQLIKRVPAVAKVGERAVFRDLEDGVLVVDVEGAVVRANPQARAYVDAGDLVGEPVGPLLDLFGVDEIGGLPTRVELDGRTFQVEASRIRNWQGERFGHALLVRDITSLVTREQRLDVLNRILRHNVRTEMNVVLGVGEHLRSYDDGELAGQGSQLLRTAEALTAISEKATDIDRLFQEATGNREVSLPDLVESVLAPLAEEYPAATIDRSVEAGSVRTDRDLLGSLLEEVVTNALIHGGQAPAVHVDVRPTGTGVELTVTDDGPGIPEFEVTPLSAGQETPLDHTTSIGVWFVTWGMQVLGGSVDFEPTESGTRVTLAVPDGGGGADGRVVVDEPGS
jgi:signal transduction histidine kinase